MKITSIRFDFTTESRPGAGELLAFASLELENSLIIKRMRVVGYPDGRISVFMPSRMVQDKFEDIVYPSSRELRESIASEILATLAKELAARGEDDKHKRVVAAICRQAVV